MVKIKIKDKRKNEDIKIIIQDEDNEKEIRDYASSSGNEVSHGEFQSETLVNTTDIEETLEATSSKKTQHNKMETETISGDSLSNNTESSVARERSEELSKETTQSLDQVKHEDIDEDSIKNTIKIKTKIKIK
jgi:tRNA A22 N-methylase